VAAEPVCVAARSTWTTFRLTSSVPRAA
jgi:hypothetical protein